MRRTEPLPTWDELVELAATHDIHHIGVAPADVLDRARAALVERKRAGLHAGIQAGHVRQGGCVAAVDEDQARGGNVLQQRGVDFRRMVGGGELAALKRPQRGVFPGLAARAGQPVLEHGLQRGAAAGVVLEAAGQRLQQGAHATSGAMRSLTQA